MNSQKLLSKLKEKKVNNIDIQPVLLNSSLYLHLEKYLKDQKFLEFNKIKKIIHLIFLKDRPLGFVMLNAKGKIVGFLGSIFFSRNISSIQRECCYIHTWLVEEKYRIFAYKLILPILEQDLNISTFTPIKNLVGLYKKLNFKIFELNYKAVLSFKFKISEKKNLLIKTINEGILSKDDYKIYKDHHNFETENILFQDKKNPEKNCLVIGRKILKRKIIPFFNLIHISDREIFIQNREEILNFLKIKYKVLFFGEYYINHKESCLDNFTLIQMMKKNTICIKNKDEKYSFNCLYSEFIVD